MNNLFSSFALWTSEQCGKPRTFGIAILTVLVWALTGPFFHFGDSWQLVANTFLNIVAYLMLFLLQSAQNRDALAMQLKLDELIRANLQANDTLIHLEKSSDAEIAEVKDHMHKHHHHLRHSRTMVSE